jgi:hypothetical protein
MTSGAYVVKLKSLKKLECLSLAILSILVQHLRVTPEPAPTATKKVFKVAL